MLDYFDMEGRLTEEERLVRDTAREFVQEEVAPDIADHWEAGTFPNTWSERWATSASTLRTWRGTGCRASARQPTGCDAGTGGV
jgi:alkylation response protein AidB-like acyl-CoA dehydrogenase